MSEDDKLLFLVIGLVAIWFFFIRRKGVAVVGAPPAYPGYAPGVLPPGVSPANAAGAPITIGGAVGGTSAAQDAGAIIGGLGSLAGGLLGAGGLGGLFGGGGGSGIVGPGTYVADGGGAFGGGYGGDY